MKAYFENAVRLHIVIFVALEVLVGAPALGSPHPQQTRTVVYEPEQKDHVRMVYVDGQPVAVVVQPELPVVLKLSEEKLGGRTYLKLWGFVLNQGGQPIELIPQSHFSVAVLGEDESVFLKISPQTPSTILKAVDTERGRKQTAVLLAGVVGALGTNLSAQSKAEAEAKNMLNQERIGSALNVIESVYSNMKDAISEQLLRRNTLNSGVSANGNVWFYFGYNPVTAHSHELSASNRAEYRHPMGSSRYDKPWVPSQWKYRVSLSIPGSPLIEATFVPALGE